jgi:hypothetical protein
LATGRFSGKIFSKVSTSGHKGSNNTGFKSLSCPGAEPIKGQTNKQTNFEYYIDIYDILYQKNKRRINAKLKAIKKGLLFISN